MITEEIKEQITNHVRSLQLRYKELKLEHERYNEEYWKIFDSTVQLLEGEIFKWIPGYERLYLISNHGRVYSKISEKILKSGVDSDGYFIVSLCKNKKKLTKTIHTLVLQTFIGDKLKNQQVRHIDGNRKNNKASNLVYGTAKENQDDRGIHGTKSYGEWNGNSYLTEKEIVEIREKYRTGRYTHRQLAKEYHVVHTTIGDIVRKEIWKHLK